MTTGTGTRRPGRRARAGQVLHGLALGCHPGPCVAVTAFATGYAATAGAGAGTLGLLAAAVLAGQLCVGWSNDGVDAARDVAAGRRDKPVAAGLVDRRTLLVASGLAAAACAALSLPLGLLPAGLHVVAVLSAVGYNLVAKRTPLSPLPYLVSFALLPVVAHLVADGRPPPVAHVLAAGMLGLAAHAGNTVGDAEADAATGVRGLPQRLGPGRSLLAMAVLICGAAVVLLAEVVSAAGTRRLPATVLLAAGAALAVAGAAGRVGVPGGRAAWRLTLLAVTLVVAGFLASV